MALNIIQRTMWMSLFYLWIPMLLFAKYVRLFQWKIFCKNFPDIIFQNFQREYFQNLL